MSDSDSDDSLLDFNINSESKSKDDGKRDRKQTKRLVDEAEAEVDEFDLSRLAAESSKSTKKYQKLGFESRSEAVSSIFDKSESGIDLEYINKKISVTVEPSNQSTDDILGDASGDEDEEGDSEGKMRNIYSGGRIILCRQNNIWPKCNDLAFNLKQAKLDDAGCGDLYSMYEFLAKTTQMAPNDYAEILIEVLMRRQNNGIHNLLAASAKGKVASKCIDSPIAKVPSGSSKSSIKKVCDILVPSALWKWLVDVVCFHPLDSVASAASCCLKQIIELIPTEQVEEVEVDTTAQSYEINGRWNPSRPLNFAGVCRFLCALGLDPTADDPSISTIAKSNNGSTGGDNEDDDGASDQKLNIGLSSKFVPRSPYSYHAASLSRVLELWGLCFEGGMFEFTQEELLCFANCLMVLSVDIVALGTPSLLFHRDRLLAVIFRCFSKKTMSHLMDDSDSPYASLLGKMKTLLNSKCDDEVKMLILRSIPVANTNGVGKMLLSHLAMHLSKQAFPEVEGSSAEQLSMSETENQREKYSLEAFMCVQSYFSTYCTENAVRALYENEGVVRMNCLYSMVDLLLMAAAPHYEYSVDECNEMMVKFIKIANSVVRMTPDPAQLNFKLLLQSLQDKYGPLVEAAASKPVMKQSKIKFDCTKS